jgi:transposase
MAVGGFPGEGGLRDGPGQPRRRLADAGLAVDKVELLLPPRPEHPLGCHNPRVPDRDAMDAILLVLRTGMQWNALNATGICHSSSSHRRFQEWERAGVFHEIWRRGLLEYDAEIGIDWSWLAADGAMTKAPLGGPATGPNPLIEPKGGEALAPHRGCRNPDRDRPGRRQPPRQEAPRADA